ncbi:MAG: hypothetical protein KBI01_02860 [Oscillospiraceae bacterium]|nr:hypothetical protein [Oscillospiraceae bacterium]
MPKYVVNNRIIAFILLLSFLLINLAVIPTVASLSNLNHITEPLQNSSENNASLSLGILNSYDYQDAEYFYYKIGSSQSFQTRRLIEESHDTLASALPYALSFISFYALLILGMTRRSSSLTITEFMHAKDGML